MTCSLADHKASRVARAQHCHVALLSMAADWPELLRALGPFSASAPALVLSCGAEARAIATLTALRVSCLHAASDYAQDAPLPTSVTMLRQLPRRANYGLLVVPAVYWHARRSPTASLRRLHSRLAANAPTLILCTGGVSQLGLSSAVELLSTLLHTGGEAMAETQRLHLAFSLLQALPSTHALVRNGPLLRSTDLSDLDTLDALMPAESPTAINSAARRAQGGALLVHRFVREVCSAGFRVRRLRHIRATPNLTGGQTHQSLVGSLSAVGGDGGARLASLARALPWLHRAQLAELYFADQVAHVAIARPAACGQELERQLDELDATLSGLETRMGLEYSKGGETHRSAAQSGSAHGALGAAAVAEQYEGLPFPPRHPMNERGRPPIHSSLASLVEVSHFIFRGRFRRRFCGASRSPFRAIVLGGGTGDATVQLAHELAALHAYEPACLYNRSEIVQVDLSLSSTRIAYRRLRERGLRAELAPPVHDYYHPSRGRNMEHSQGPRIRLVVGSILSLPGLQLGRFDFINLCGVLHHTPNPKETLALISTHALAKGGGIGLMVYGRHGRSGVYETQAMLRMLHASGNATAAHAVAVGSGKAQPSNVPWPRAAQVSDAFNLLSALPRDATLRRNAAVWASDEARGKMGDAGIADLLLNPIDEPYTRPTLIAHADAAGLEPSGWLQRGLYDWRYWLQPCNGIFAACEAAPPLPLLRERLELLGAEASAEVSEMLSGHARKHWVYLVRSREKKSTDPGGLELPAVYDGLSGSADADGDYLDAGAATGLEPDLAPCVLNMSDATMRLLTSRSGRGFSVRSTLQGASLTSEMPPTTSAVLQRVNCHTPLRKLRALVTATSPDGGGMAAESVDFDQQWTRLFAALSDVGFIFMSDVYSESIPIASM